jgi:PhnB protein
MLTANPYLHFKGNTEDAMKFYKSIFGGEFTIFQRFRDVPGSERMPANEQDMIIHISLTLPNGVVLMATDALESMGQKLIEGNNFHICIQAESVVETERLFSELSKGGVVEMPLNETMWGAYFGMLKDKFGIQWMINHTHNQTNK